MNSALKITLIAILSIGFFGNTFAEAATENQSSEIKPAPRGVGKLHVKNSLNIRVGVHWEYEFSGDISNLTITINTRPEIASARVLEKNKFMIGGLDIGTTKVTVSYNQQIEGKSVEQFHVLYVSVQDDYGMHTAGNVLEALANNKTQAASNETLVFIPGKGFVPPSRS